MSAWNDGDEILTAKEMSEFLDSLTDFSTASFALFLAAHFTRAHIELKPALVNDPCTEKLIFIRKSRLFDLIGLYNLRITMVCPRNNILL